LIFCDFSMVKNYIRVVRGFFTIEKSQNIKLMGGAYSMRILTSARTCLFIK
jgi:hypothetical protein